MKSNIRSFKSIQPVDDNVTVITALLFKNEQTAFFPNNLARYVEKELRCKCT